jgi:hypothetical protein
LNFGLFRRNPPSDLRDLRYRASGLNLAAAAINSLEHRLSGHAVDEPRSRGEIIPGERPTRLPYFHSNLVDRQK